MIFPVATVIVVPNPTPVAQATPACPYTITENDASRCVSKAEFEQYQSDTNIGNLVVLAILGLMLVCLWAYCRGD